MQKTSLDAYSTIDKETQAYEVLSLLRKKETYGGTCYEIHRDMPIEYSHWKDKPYGTVSARMSKLKKEGMIFNKGITRLASGSQAEVWVAKEFATPEEIELTTRPTGNKQAVKEIAQNTIAFLESLERSKSVEGIWLKGMHHNIAELKKVLEIVK